MRNKIHPLWWPTLLVASPLLAPLAIFLAWRLKREHRRVDRDNLQRLASATTLDLPVLRELQLTVLVDWRHREGFLGDAAVSYLISS